MDNFYKNESYLLHLYSIFIMLDITFKWTLIFFFLQEKIVLSNILN